MNNNSTKRVLVLGATGSIGKSTIDILRNQKDRFSCAGITANKNKDELDSLAREFNCPSCLTSAEGTDGIKKLIDNTKPDIVVNGIAGSAGLVPTMLVLQSGIDLALANKESVVMAGPLIFDLARKNNCSIIPVDSEHSAIFTLLNQCGGPENVDRLMITASGGPFRTWPSDKIKDATLQDALKHPTWDMGVKITVDSATMGNKGLEVIEARRLFSFDTKNIQVVVHPQSIVHSLVRTKDGIVYGQLSHPDMKHPIIQALDWPKISTNFMKPFDLTDTADGSMTLTFEKPRMDDFPLLGLAFEAAKNDGSSPITFNASNEVAVAAFIEGNIRFSGIADIVTHVMQKSKTQAVTCVEDIFECDREARALAAEYLKK
jgi:1-deoxy-D-xylulose-5-phosphate reductoisomerase